MAENPGTESIESLLKCVHDGTYVIPYFQRGFEWQASMICDLFESILQNYYTGLILLWELDAEKTGKEKWDPVWGSKLGNNPPKMAILDGQQRLSSLYYAIYNPHKRFPNRRSYYVFFLDLNKVLNEDYDDAVTYRYYANYQSWKNLMQSKDDWAESGVVPLPILSAEDPIKSGKTYIDSKEFESFINEYLDKNRQRIPDEVTVHTVYMVLRSILNYDFVFFPLNDDRELPDICNIFARVNAKGMRLSTFDLMNAFLYPKGIELRKVLWEGLNNDTLKDIDPNMNEYLLKLISLKKQNYCSSKYIYNLIPGEKTTRIDEHGNKYEHVFVKDGDEFESLWEDACKYAEKAREIIMNTGDHDFGAIKTAFIPNTTIVPVLGAVLWEYDGDIDNSEFRDMLSKWYWSAVFSEDYSGSSDSVMGRDFRDWKEWMRKHKAMERVSRINKDFILNMDLKNVRKGSARYNAILCLIALNGAKDFYKGWTVGLGDFSDENIDDHHIFPNSLKDLDSKEFKETKDSILNKTLILDETNKLIKNKKPSQYITEIINKHGNEVIVKSVLEKHLISKKAFQYMAEDDFDSFISEREKTIKNHIISELGIDDIVSQTVEESLLNEITASEKQRELHNFLVEMIERDPDLILDDVDESCVRFTSKDLDFLPRECYNWTESKRMLLLVVSNKPNGVVLSSYIGPGPKEIRIQLHEIVRGNLDFFNAARNKSWLGNGMTWSTIYKKRWLGKEGYEEKGINEIKRILEKGLTRFKETDLPMMVELLRKSVTSS